MTLPLRLLVTHPEQMDDLSLGELAALAIQVGAKIVEKAGQSRAGLAPLLDVDAAAPLLGMHPDTLRKRAKSDPAIRALTVDVGTKAILFDVAKIEAFRKRRSG